MPTIIYAGMYHETHTFSSVATSIEDFKKLVGDQVLSRTGDGSQTDGFLSSAQDNQIDVIPVADYVATPSGVASRDVLEQFASILDRTFAEHGERAHAVFLALHGAMVVKGETDVEGAIIARIRNSLARAGRPQLPIFGVTDLHGNVSKRMVGRGNALLCYRENPHIDAFDTGVRATELMLRCLREKSPVYTTLLQFPVLLSPGETGTAFSPMKDLIEIGRAYETANESVAAVNVYAGFCYADTVDSGVSASITTFGEPGDHRALRHELVQVLRRYCETKPAYAKDRESIGSILASEAALPRPIVIADAADNVGGGAPGNTTALLKEFLHRPDLHTLTVLWDPDMVLAYWDVPVGQVKEMQVGGGGNSPHSSRLTITAKIASKHEGWFTLEDPNSHLAAFEGTRTTQGRTIVLEIGRATVVVHSRRIPPFDLGQLQSLGIAPEEYDAISVKAAVGHRRAYDKISGSNVLVELPGSCPSDLRKLEFKKLRRPIYPLDPQQDWEGLPK